MRLCSDKLIVRETVIENVFRTLSPTLAGGAACSVLGTGTFCL